MLWETPRSDQLGAVNNDAYNEPAATLTAVWSYCSTGKDDAVYIGTGSLCYCIGGGSVGTVIKTWPIR